VCGVSSGKLMSVDIFMFYDKKERVLKVEG
ncbi:MAG: hypothetical protein ACJA04_000879, partial [Cellvibrionaceae bacterium]